MNTISDSDKFEVRVKNGKDDQRFLAEFIDIYRRATCLWKYNCKYYRNKAVKDLAYNALVLKMRSVDPRADKNSVIRKINGMRTAFRREFKKIRKSERLDRSSGETIGTKIYTTSLWYYDLMKFVVEDQDHTEPPPGPNFGDWDDTSIGESEQTYTNVDKDGTVVDHDAHTLMDFLEDDTPNDQQPIKVEPSSSVSSRAASPVAESQPLNFQINAVYSEKSNPQEQYVATQPRSKRQRVSHYQSKETDQPDFDLFGAYVASKLKRASRKQSVIAEKVIAEVLMRASLGTLEETTMMTDVKVPSSSNSLSRKS